MNKNKPDIRFKGFTDDWKYYKLLEVANKVIEKNIEMIYTETLTNSAEFGIMSQRDYFNHDISNTENLNHYYIVKENDFVYNPRISILAPVGPINRNKLGKIGVMSPLYTVFRTHDIDNAYLEQFFKSNYWHAFMKLNGDSGVRSDRFSIKDSIFIKMLIPYSCIKEQQQIGEYLTNFDELITLCECKYEKLKSIKKAILEKMFPKEGSDIPEIRFKGFTDTWKQYKLKEIGETFSGLSGKSKSDFGHGEGKFITYMNVFSNPIANLKAIESIEIDDNQNKVNYGDVLFTTSSETPEEVGMSSVWLGNDKNTYLNSFCFGYRLIKKFDNYYLAYMFRSTPIRKKIIFLAQGISRYNISKNKVMDIIILNPHIQEQKKIGIFFKHLDSLISLYQQKYEKLKNIKKAMLEKMFI